MAITTNIDIYQITTDLTAIMDRIDLCARISQLLRSDGSDARADSTATQTSIREVIDQVVAASASASAATDSPSPVDEMLVTAFQRLVLSTIRACSRGTQERAFDALLHLITANANRLTLRQVVELLQTCVVYLPTPAVVIAEDASKDTRVPEDLCIAVVRAMQALLSVSTAKAAVQSLTSATDHVNFLAYTISCLLQIAERQRNHELAALAVHVLVHLHASISSANILRQFFPGVAVGMWKTISAPMQSSKVIVAAIECLTLAVKKCMRQSEASVNHARFSIDSVRQLQGQLTQAHSEGSSVTSEDLWLDTAAEKFDLILSRLLADKSVSIQSWRVRLAVAQLCRAIVLDCRVALPDAFLRCLEELMVLTTHPISDVATDARTTLDRLQTKLTSDEWLALEPTFIERFQIHWSTLEVKAGTDLESVSVHVMEILMGYLAFFGDRLRNVLDGDMEPLLKTLSRVVALESLDVDLLRYENVRRQNQDNENESGYMALLLPYYQKRYRNFHEESSVRAITRLLRYVGSVATVEVVVDSAFAMMHNPSKSTNRDCATVLVILCECLRAHVSERGASERVHFVGRILDDLFALPVWSSPPREFGNEMMALLAECVGVCVDLVGAEFDQYLLHTLYPLVEILGDHSSVVERSALTTLQKIALHSGYGTDLHAFFSANMDYLVDALCMRLTRLDEYRRSPQVVEALLQHSTIASLPLVDEITSSLLLALDVYQDDQPVTITLMRSLQLLLDSHAQMKNHGNHDIKRPESVEANHESPLARLLLEMRAWADPAELSENDAGQHDVDVNTVEANKPIHAMLIEHPNAASTADQREGADDADDEPLPLPFQAQTVQVLDRCGYFVADPDPAMACLALATIEKGVRYLRSRRKQLLPLIHRLWPAICHRLHSQNRPILIATLRLLTTIAECAGDFIGERFVETVWSSVRSIMTAAFEAAAESVSSITRDMLTLSTSSPRADESTSVAQISSDLTPRHEARESRRSLEMRLVEAALGAMHVVAENASAMTSIVEDVVDTCVGFVDPRFPVPVGSAAEQLLLTLATLNGDLVFAKLAVLADWRPPAPSSRRFPAYTLKLPSPGSVTRVTVKPSRQHKPSMRLSSTEEWRLRVRIVLDKVSRVQ